MEPGDRERGAGIGSGIPNPSVSSSHGPHFGEAIYINERERQFLLAERCDEPVTASPHHADVGPQPPDTMQMMRLLYQATSPLSRFTYVYHRRLSPSPARACLGAFL